MNQKGQLAGSLRPTTATSTATATSSTTTATSTSTTATSTTATSTTAKSTTTTTATSTTTKATNDCYINNYKPENRFVVLGLGAGQLRQKRRFARSLRSGDADDDEVSALQQSAATAHHQRVFPAPLEHLVDDLQAAWAGGTGWWWRVKGEVERRR